MNSVQNVNKVILMFPNQAWYKFDLTTTWNLSPYVLCLLGEILIRRGYSVKIIDCQFYNMSEEEFKKELEDYQPDLVGISILTSEYADTADMAARIAKEVNPQIVTIMGGVHPTTQHKRVMRNKDIDYACRGEAEEVFPQFLDWLNARAEFPHKGIVYRDELGNIVALPPDYIQDLDALPRPNYDLVDFEAYTMTGPRYGVDTIQVFPYARILTSRGCPVGCSFCQVESISGHKWRHHSAERVVDDLKWLKKKYGIKAFIFEDDNAFATKWRTRKLFTLLKEADLNLQWKAAGVTIWTMDKDILRLMAETGCQMLCIAIETGTNRVMNDVIGKPVKLESILPIIKYASEELGIFMAANFIIGFPGESWEEIRTTLRYAETCGVDYVKIYPAQPLVGTKLYDMAVEMDAIVGDHEEVGWRYGRMRSTEFNQKDISILRVYEWDRINFTDPVKRARTAKIMGISEKKLNQIRTNTRNKLTFEDFDWSLIDTSLDEITDNRTKAFSE